MPTKIEWADESWNPVTGCTKVDDGCRNCYAKRMANRLRGRCGYPADDPFRVTLHPDRLEKPLHWKKPRRVFVNSMSDLFHPDVHSGFIRRIFSVMLDCEQHTFMILTKRAGRMAQYIERYPWSGAMKEAGNVWLGVSVHDQKSADERIPILLQTPAAHRFVSFEPALGAVDFRGPLYGFPEQVSSEQHVTKEMAIAGGDLALEGSLYSEEEWAQTMPSLDLIICGGESGPGARPMHPDWVRSTRDQCQEAGVKFHFKHWGAYKPVYSAGDPDGKSVMALPDGTITNTGWNGGAGLHLRGSQALYRMSKKSAQKYWVYPPIAQYPCIDNDGRSLLDGVLHDGGDE